MIRNARSSLQARVLRHARELWRGLTRDWFGSYRPELHYMRGPGLKWREKHAYARAPASRRARD
jgi:hypothetical protein